MFRLAEGAVHRRDPDHHLCRGVMVCPVPVLPVMFLNLKSLDLDRAPPGPVAAGLRPRRLWWPELAAVVATGAWPDTAEPWCRPGFGSVNAVATVLFTAIWSRSRCSVILPGRDGGAIVLRPPRGLRSRRLAYEGLRRRGEPWGRGDGRLPARRSGTGTGRTSRWSRNRGPSMIQPRPTSISPPSCSRLAWPESDPPRGDHHLHVHRADAERGQPDLRHLLSPLLGSIDGQVVVFFSLASGGGGGGGGPGDHRRHFRERSTTDVDRSTCSGF